MVLNTILQKNVLSWLKHAIFVCVCSFYVQFLSVLFLQFWKVKTLVPGNFEAYQKSSRAFLQFLHLKGL